MLELATRLRERASRKRELAEKANTYYRNYQRNHHYIREDKIQDRSDYAQTLADCDDMEEAAKLIRGFYKLSDHLIDTHYCNCDI